MEQWVFLFVLSAAMIIGLIAVVLAWLWIGATLETATDGKSNLWFFLVTFAAFVATIGVYWS